MSAFDWKPQYATGIVSIDAQHIALFQTAKALHNAFGNPKAKEEIAHGLTHLATYCGTHFEDEEAHMESLNYPELTSHRAEHRHLMSQVYHMQEQYAQGDKQIAMSLSIFLEKWLKKHILGSDQHFAEFIRSSQHGAEPL